MDHSKLFVEIGKALADGELSRPEIDGLYEFMLSESGYEAPNLQAVGPGGDAAVRLSFDERGWAPGVVGFFSKGVKAVIDGVVQAAQEGNHNAQTFLEQDFAQMPEWICKYPHDYIADFPEDRRVDLVHNINRFRHLEAFGVVGGNKLPAKLKRPAGYLFKRGINYQGSLQGGGLRQIGAFRKVFVLLVDGTTDAELTEHYAAFANDWLTNGPFTGENALAGRKSGPGVSQDPPKDPPKDPD